MLTAREKIDILFVIPPYHKRNGSGSFFPLGISSIVACVDERGHTWNYIDCTEIIDSLDSKSLHELNHILLEQLQYFDPGMIGIGPCVTPGAKGLEVVASCCIQMIGVERVFAGGPFTSLPSQEWFFYEHLNLKYLIKGEGEEAVCQAIDTIKFGRSLSECTKVSFAGRSVMNSIDNLDAMPFPKRINLEKNRLSDRRKMEALPNTEGSYDSGASIGNGMIAQIVASRGCPYCCSYCVSGNLKEIKFRKRSPKSIVAEMTELSVQYGINDIVFYDDCFFTSAATIHKEIEEFCDTISSAHLNITWQIEIRPDIISEITDSEFRRLEETGCRQVNIGVERTDANGAEIFGKRFSFDELKSTIQRIHHNCHIRVTGTFILGGKDQSIEDVREIIHRSKVLNLDDAEFSPLFVYPDTPIYREIFRTPKEWLDVILSDNDPWGEIVFENEYLDKDQLIALVAEAYEYFHNEDHGKNGENEEYSNLGKHSFTVGHYSDRYNLKGVDKSVSNDG